MSRVLGQAKTYEKSNEKTAIPALLEELDLKGALVSIDAAVNKPAIAKLIVEQQGHYLLSLNQLHWHLDVSFDEDRCRTHIKNEAKNRNTLRKMALQLLKQVDDKHSIKVRRKKAGWHDKYLTQIIRQYCPG